MTVRDAITKAQIALYEQDPVGNAGVIQRLDEIAGALQYISDAKIYVDRVAQVLTPSGRSGSQDG